MHTPTPPTMSYLTDIYFHAGSAQLLPELLERLSIRRPLIVTDRGVVQAGLLAKLDPASKVLPTVSSAGEAERPTGASAPRGRFVAESFPIFDQVQTNPRESSALAAARIFRDQNCDGLIALGGGAPIDLAKIIALLIHHPLPLQQYAIVHGGIPRITAKLPPLIAIPTTAGSGSEVGRAALLVLSTGEKLGFLSPHLLPKAALCDPELTCSLPPLLTAATGMDAISHAVETFCSPRKNPVADDLALAALGRGFANIETATRDGQNLDARSDMLLCSLEAGLAFQKSLGAVHSLSHPLGALPGKLLHHGTLNAIFLPHVLRFNAPAIPDKLARIARLLNIGADELPETFARLSARLGLPPNLSAMGVTAADLEPLAEKAAADHCSPTNPRALGTEDCRGLYLAAL